jgi:flotillin
MEAILSNLSGTLGLVLGAVVGILILLFVIGRASRMYHRVPPSRVMVVYGRGKTEFEANGKTMKTGVRLVTGGGALVWPIFEEFQALDLTIMSIEQSRDKVYTIDGIPLNLDWVASVQIGSDEVALLTAARAFLGMDQQQIIDIVTKTLSTNNRAIVGQMTVEELHRDRDAFVRKVQELAADEMAAMGLSIKQMGVRDITDEEGYFEAMAAPKIAAVKRDATIAQAEADRDGRTKAAAAQQAAQQAELDAKRAIIEQQQQLDLRLVQKDQTVNLAKAAADQKVQEQRALVVAQEQEVTLLAPARAKKEAQLIQAESDKQQATVNAQAAKEVKLTQAAADAEFARQRAKGEADAIRETATAESEATERRGRAEAAKLQVLKEAEAAGITATLTAEAQGTEAKLKAEAAGKRDLAEAAAAQGEINLRQFVAETLIMGDVKKVEAIATALAGIGQNTRIVQFAGGTSQNAGTGNALVDLLMQVPELATIVNAKTEALSEGHGITDVLLRVAELMKTSLSSVQARQDESALSEPNFKGKSAQTDTVVPVATSVGLDQSDSIAAVTAGPKQKPPRRKSN